MKRSAVLLVLFVTSVVVSSHDDIFSKIQLRPQQQNGHVLERKIKEKDEQKAMQKLSSEFNYSLKKLQQSINKEYGAYSKSLFLDEYFKPAPKFVDRLVRRYQIKILQSYFSGKDQSFVWSTSGHSAAAGHGNLFNQTFTAIIEQTVQNVFKSVGVKFEARNYAMGGMGSFPELALCMESIYGSDVDILSWDFGMTDAGPEQNLAGITLWGNRAGLITSFPLLFGFGSTRERIEKFMEFPGSLCLDYEKLDRRKEVIPDSSTVLDFESIPMPLRYYNCKGHLESLEPCGDLKFDTRICPHIEGQVSWHPGWKEHLFLGRLIGLYLVNMLQKALSALAKPGNFSMSLLKELQEEEIKDRSDFLYSQADISLWAEFVPNKKLATNLFRKEIVCHTALLPSEIRYKGILYPSPNGKLINGMDQKMYGSSTESTIFKDKVNALRLVYDEEEHKKEICDAAPTRIDFKDRFFIGNEQLSVSFTLPTDNELKAYKHAVPTQRTKVVPIICHLICDWGSCPDDYITVEQVLPADQQKRRHHMRSLDVTEYHPHGKVHINGKQVVQVSKIRSNCYVLENEDGPYWDYSPIERLNFKFEIDTKDKHLYITSIILNFD